MKWLFLILLMVIVGFSPFHALAQSALQKEIEIRKGKLEKLQKKISKERKKVGSLKTQELSILRELEEIDNKIVEQWEKLQETKKTWTEKEHKLINTRKECDELRQAVSILKKQVELRLDALYKMGAIGTLNVIFSAETLPQIISRHNSMKVILMHDRLERVEFLERLKELSNKERQLKNERKELIQLTKELESQGLLLESIKKEKESFFEKILSKKEIVKKTIRELNEAKTSLSKLVFQLEYTAKKLPLDPDFKYVAADSFTSQKGKLPAPVEGLILKHSRTPFNHKATGLIFEVALGSEIRAIFDGVIMYNGKLKGYGNVLIIDHGENYCSLISQGAKFFPAIGQEVIEGDVVGVVGGGPWVKEGIYLEIRHEGKEEDPRKWLDLKRIPKSG